ncbi:hypothetical protein GCM10009534_72500 [Kribbella sandramycini]
MIVDPADRWMDRAACAGQAGAFDETATRFEQRKARELCLSHCPVLAECHAWARRTKYTGTAAGQTLLEGRRRGHPNTAAS